MISRLSCSLYIFVSSVNTQEVPVLTRLICAFTIFLHEDSSFGMFRLAVGEAVLDALEFKNRLVLFEMFGRNLG